MDCSTAPLINRKTIEEVWRAILLYEEISPGAYDAGVITGCRNALAEAEGRALVDPNGGSR